MNSLNINKKYLSGAKTVVVTESDSGRRLDRVLRMLMPDVPNSRICRMIRNGELRVNGRRARPGQLLEAGERLRLPPVELRQDDRKKQYNQAVPAAILVQLQQCLLYEDERFIILNKPAGLAVHGGGRLRYDLLRAMRQLRSDCGFLELGHRLDRDTSGYILLCKTAVAQRQVHEIFRHSRVRKYYAALVMGVPEMAEMEISIPLQHYSGNRYGYSKASPHGKPAQTILAIRHAGAGASLLQLQPLTGRTHQLRVHLAQTGHPIAGDRKYGNRDFNRDLCAIGLNRLFLHAETLRFPPQTGIPDLHADLPSDLAKIAARILSMSQDGL